MAWAADANATTSGFAYLIDFTPFPCDYSQYRLILWLPFIGALGKPGASTISYSSASYADNVGLWLMISTWNGLLFVPLWMAFTADSSTTTSGFAYLIVFTSFRLAFCQTAS